MIAATLFCALVGAVFTVVTIGSHDGLAWGLTASPFGAAFAAILGAVFMRLECIERAGRLRE